MKQIISKAAIERLALYFRILKSAQEEGVEIISSEEIGKRTDFTPVQIRKDLALFGQFGMKGVGYFTNDLLNKIGNILGLNNHWKVAIIGIGHLGGALANYRNFANNGFKLTALFDKDEKVIGSKVHDLEISDVKDLKKIIKEREIQIGVITVPEAEAQGVANLLTDAVLRRRN